MLHLGQSLLQMLSIRTVQHSCSARACWTRESECSETGRCREGQAALIAPARTCCTHAWVLTACMLLSQRLMHNAAGASGGEGRRGRDKCFWVGYWAPGCAAAPLRCTPSCLDMQPSGTCTQVPSAGSCISGLASSCRHPLQVVAKVHPEHAAQAQRR